jgi:microsomal dipeptidase-like Zn-dependent dipeptidase
MTKRAGVVVLGASLGLAGSSVWAGVPAAPTSLRGDTSVPGEVALSWDASSGADSYNVYRSVDPLLRFRALPPAWEFVGAFTPIATNVSSPTYTDSGLPPLVRQFYVVTAVNGEGESPLSFSILPPSVEVRVTAPPDATVFGFADMHSHAFANLAFGGRLVWGDAWSPSGGAPDALRSCEPLHGLGGLGDIIGNALGGHLGHNVQGWGSFAGWPNFDSYTHQQMYYEWLKRAYDGGLRLLVVHAVNNKVLCEFGGGSPADCDDMVAVDRQIQAAKDMEAFIDGQPGGGWFKIAYSAADARRIINGGGMAVVLGIEVDELFGCGVNSTTCTPETVAQQLDYYYGQGVRHVFPIHVFDNAFGGAALYNDLFNYGNKKVAGAFFTPRDCAAEGYSYKPQSNFLIGLLGTFLGLGNPDPHPEIVAECNNRGLTGLGASFIRQLMRKKMIIDVDHMSATTADAALSIVEEQGYPVVAGHTGLSIVSMGQKAHEGQKTSAQIGRIAALGGLVAPILEQGERVVSGGTSGITAAPGSTVANDCGRSSKTWAQAYLGAVALLGGPATASVGLGSDFNGLAGEPGPRFGPNRCKDDPSPSQQYGGVGYPFPIFAPPGVDAGHLDRATAGTRTFDYNTDGLAHVGLLPDFLQDLRSSGLSDEQLQPLFRSAEAYLQVWQTVESKQVYAPTVSATVAPAGAAAGWVRDDVTVTITATPNPQGGANVRARYAATGATAIAPTTADAAVASLTLVAEGTTTVTFSAVDDLGVHSPEQTLVVQIDRSAPTVTCPAASTTWFAGNVVLQCTTSDGLSGLVNAADSGFDLSTSVPAGVETADAPTDTRTVADAVGNVAVAGPIGGNHVDRKAPTISITLSGDGTYLVGQPATVTYACDDGGSGVASCTGTPASGGALDTATPGAKHVTVASADAVGNASSADSSYTVAYNVCLLYDTSKIKKTGSTIPVKLQVCDASTANLSRPDLLVTATAVTMVSNSTAGVLDDSGQANPDFNFRYDPGLAGYIFNLSTKGLAPGSWHLVFRIAGDPTDHAALFQLR